MEGRVDAEQQLNLNGEFLGVTSMAAYSAPWFLKIPLLILVGLLFYFKIAHNSRRLRTRVQHRRPHKETPEAEHLALANELNRLFFGFTVERKHVPIYWIGFTIFLITLGYAISEVLAKLL